MIARAIAWVLVFAATATAYAGQAAPIEGAWCQTNLQWFDAPPEIGIKERNASANVLYFRPDHVFVLVHGVVIKSPGHAAVSAGDPREDYYGRWYRSNGVVHVQYRRVYSTLALYRVPGPIQTDLVVVGRGFVELAGKRYSRDLTLDKNLQELVLPTSFADVVRSLKVR